MLKYAIADVVYKVAVTTIVMFFGLLFVGLLLACNPSSNDFGNVVGALGMIYGFVSFIFWIAALTLDR